MFEGEWLNDTKCNGRGRDVYNTGIKRRRKSPLFYTLSLNSPPFHQYIILDNPPSNIASGNIYEGEWKDKKRHGKGKLRYVGASLLIQTSQNCVN